MVGITIKKAKNPQLKEGSITLRKSDNRYMGKVRNNENGFKYVYDDTYLGCVDKINDYIAYRDRYLSDVKFFDWIDDFLIDYKKPNVKTRTFDGLKRNVRLHIKPKFPCKILLRDVKPPQIQKALMSIEGSRTRKMVYDFLFECFQTAKECTYIDFFPMGKKAVKIPSHKYQQGYALSTQELKDFFVSIQGHVLEDYFKFLIYTGTRRSEALGIKVSDIDLENNIIHINGTKTKASARIFPIFSQLLDVLLEVLATKSLEQEKLFAFSPDYATHAFKKLCPAHKLHDLRHTFATLCLKSGVSSKVTQEWLGHSKIDTTLNIYSHVDKELHFKEVKKLTIF